MNDLTRAVKGSQLKNQPLKRDKSKNIDTSIAEQRAYEFLVRQQEAKEWIQEVVGEKLSGSAATFCDQLRDGIVLAKLAKMFDPTSVGKIHQSTGTVLEFMAVDNISKFLLACKNIRLPTIYLFEVTDLWESKSPSKVVSTVHTLANFLAETGKAIKMKNLEAAGLVFNQEDLERAWRDLQDMEGGQMTFTVSGSSGQDDGQKDLYDSDSDLDDKLLDDNVASAHTCVLEGDAVNRGIAGVQNKFIIKARDFDERELTVGGEVFEVKLFLKSNIKSTPVVGTVKDLQNGQYEVTYIPEVAGEYRMEIVLVDVIDEEEEEETMLKQCPINVQVDPSRDSDPSKSELSGLGLSSATAGSETSFTLNTKDRFGNVKTTGGENFSAVLVNGSEKVQATVVDNEDGSYVFKYTCPKSGDYQLDISLNGQSAFDKKTVNVKDAGVSDPSQSVVIGLDKLAHIVAGQPASFSIQAKDKLGNDRSSGGEKFVATLAHSTDSSKDVQINMVDSNDGKYEFDFVANNSGNYQLRIELEGQVVSNTATVVADTGVTDPSKCTISSNDFKLVKAGEVKKFTLTSCDEFGNPRSKGGDSFVMPIANKQNMEYSREDLVSIVDNGDGNYEVSFSIELIGEYSAQLMLKSPVAATTESTEEGDSQKRTMSNLLGFLRRYKYDNVSGFPCDVVATDSGVSDANKTEFSGKGLSGVELGTTCSFNIQTFDSYGNTRATGSDAVDVKFHNKTSGNTITKTDVSDNQDGSYTISFQPDTIGEYSIDISINGVAITNEASQQLIRAYAKSLKDISDEEIFQLDPYNWLASLSSMVALEEDDELTAIINELRQQLIRQLKDNSATEKEVDDLERKIQLLINNRMKIEEVIKSQARRGLFRRKGANEVVVKDDQEQKKRLQQLQVYGRMMYLLQAEGRYLSRLFYFVPTEKLEKFLDTILLSLFGFAFSPREEFLILRLFQETVLLEVSKVGEHSNAKEFFNNSSGILPKMIISYTRRLQGQAFLQKVLYDKILDGIISDKGLNLELNPVKLLKALDPSQLAAQVTNEKALENEQVRQAVESRKKRLVEVCNNFLTTLSENINEIPYGLRWVCKQISIELKKRYLGAGEDDLAHALTFLIFFKFLNPVIVSPDGFQLTKKKISMEMRNNLVVISKVLSNLVSNIQFASTDPYATVNEWIAEKYQSSYLPFIANFINVEDPEEALGVNEYINLTLTKTPTITISWNELFSLHGLLNERIAKICPDNEDPLRMILKSVSAVPEQLAPEDNEEVAISLINPQAATVESDTKNKVTQLYHETKINFKKVLRLLPPDRIGAGVVATLGNAEKYAASLQSSQNKHDIEVAAVLSEKTKAVKNALPILEDEKVLEPETQYKQLLIDVTRDIKNQRDVKRKQLIERDRLVESIASLEKHSSFLKERIEGLNQYIVEAVNADYDTSKHKKNEFKFSYKHLAEKHKVIESSSLNKLQQKAIKFKITMSSPGKFNVDATLAGKTVQTIEVVLSDLLDRQSKKQTKIEYDDVTLNVDKTIDILNKLFSNKK